MATVALVVMMHILDKSMNMRKKKSVLPHTREHVKNIYLGDGLGKLFWVSTSSTTGWLFYWSALKMTKCQTLRKF